MYIHIWAVANNLRYDSYAQISCPNFLACTLQPMTASPSRSSWAVSWSSQAPSLELQSTQK